MKTLIIAVALLGAGSVFAGERQDGIPVRKVVFVSKTHLDLGFTRLPHEVIAQFRTNHYPKAIAVAKATADDPDVPPYRWTVPAWLLFRSVDDPVALAGVRSGALAWHAMPMTLFTSLAGREDIARGLGFSRRLSELTGRKSYAAKLTDVPGHPWVLPDVLAENGVRFLHVGCNGGHKSPDVPDVFWWEGPAGRRVLTVYSKDYGSGVVPWKGWPFSTWLVMDMTNDNTGPLDERTYRWKIAEIRKAHPKAEIASGTLEDFYDAVAEEAAKAALPTVRGDLGNVWDFCASGFPTRLREMRETRRRVRDLERRAQAEGRLDASARETIERIYENLIILDEHSWGGDYKEFLHDWNRRGGAAMGDEVPAYRSKEEFRRTRAGARYRRLESSWHAKDRNMAEALRLTDELEDRLAGELVLENANLRVRLDRGTGGIASLFDKRLGREFAPNNGLCGTYVYEIFDAEDLAGYHRTAAKRAYDWWFADFGRIGYPKDLKHFRSSPAGFTARIVRRDATGTEIELTCRRTDADRGCREYGDARRVTYRYALGATNAALEVELALKDGDAQALVECGSIRFPFALERPVDWRLNTVGCVTDPMRDYVRDSGHSMYTLEEWADVSDAKGGVRIWALDTPIMMRGGNDIFKFRSRPEPDAAPEPWFNLFFSMQVQRWFEKDFSYRFRLEPHG